jgi:hypothetical protein
MSTLNTTNLKNESSVTNNIVLGADGSVDLGTLEVNGAASVAPLVVSTDSTERLRITSDAYVRLASGTGGIQFNGDTAAANALGDYEEGTWTPILMNGGSASTATLTASGIYVKIGNLVQVHGGITVTNIGNADGFGVGGLPFSCTSYASFGAGWLSGAANSVIGVRAESIYGSRVSMRGQNTSAWNGYSGVAIFTTGTVFEFGMTYRTT